MRNSGNKRPTSSKISKGSLIVISAPSGSGKTTIIENLLKAEPQVVRSISMTTRPPRKGERQGRDYRFVSLAQFLRARAAGVFLECARILGYWYGTPRAPIEHVLRQGKDILLCLDIQGAGQLRRSGLPVVTLFLLPPSLSALRERLRARGTETPSQIAARLKLARRELAEVRRYDYAVVNDSLSDAIADIRAILRARRCRVRR